jgi:hypothetical protein
MQETYVRSIEIFKKNKLLILKGVAGTIEHCTATEMHDLNHSNHLHLDVNDCLCQGSANLPH